jgi:Cu(I)/Ag(I) efflux system membrane fusion protein
MHAKSTLTLLAACLLLAACGEQKTEQTANDAPATEQPVIQQVKVTPTLALPPAQAANTIQPLIARYLKVKDALTKTRADSAGFFALQLATSLERIDTTGIYTDGGKKLFQYTQAIRAQALDITRTPDVEAQRAIFQKLSGQVYAMVRELGGGKQKLYKQFCPMYKDDGGFWLSTEEAIVNPYFGDKMLDCGEVQEALDFQ